MKNLKRSFALIMLALLFSVSTQASVTTTPKKKANVGQLVSGLINVNIGAIQVDVELDNVLNNFRLVNVEDVLNNNDIDILNNVLNNNTILSNNSDFLNNLLRDAEIITDNQVVVGILSGGQIVIQDI